VSRGKGDSSTFVGLIALIIAAFVLGGILLPLRANPRERARRAECAGNLPQVTLGLVQYSNDHNGDFPAAPDVVKSTTVKPGVAPEGSGEESLGLLFDIYIPEVKVFWCPSAPPGEASRIGWGTYPSSLTAAVGGRNPSFREHDHCSFAYDPRHHVSHKPDVALVADRGGGKGVNSPNHGGDGQNVLYLDGHVRWWARTDCGRGADRWSGGGDDIYIRNDEISDPRKDSWLTNSKGPSPEEALLAWEARRRRKIALIIAALAAGLLPPIVLLLIRARRRNDINHQDTKPALSEAEGATKET